MLTVVAILVGLALCWKVYEMSEALKNLQTEVADNTSVVDSAVALIGSLASQIRDNAEDPDALNALADALDTSKNKLAAAVAANTPATDDTAAEPVNDADLQPIADEPTT